MLNKTKKLLIFGTGDFAELAHFYFSTESEYEVVAFTADDQYVHKNEGGFCGKPVFKFKNITSKYPPDEHYMFIAIGYSSVNKVRAEKYRIAKEKGYKFAKFVSPKATNYSDSIGENCFIFEDNTIQPFVEIGNNVILWSGNHIGHHSKIGNHCFVASHAVISGHVSIGNYCFIGVNATIRDSVSIADNTIVGASALIMKNTKPNEVYMGERTKLFPKSSDRIGM